MNAVSPPDWSAVQAQFMLDPDEIYLNAGTFSALPRPVFDAQVALQAQAELNPTRRGVRQRWGPLWQAQSDVAAYVGADPEDLVLHYNVTQGLNQALFALDWAPGEFLVSDLEYGAIVNAVREVARRRGLTVRSFSLPRFPASAQDLVDAVLAALSPTTTAVLLSHITSPTGLLLPVEEIATALRARGVRLVVDGAHGPGLTPLQLGDSDIAVYGGNLHKWFMGPKGTAFLYVRRDLHAEMQPVVVGWGGVPGGNGVIHDLHGGSSYRWQYVFRFQGLRDFSPFLALPAALEFRAAVGEEHILARVDQLRAYARQRLVDELGLEPITAQPAFSRGLLTVAAPPGWDIEQTEERLFGLHRITVAAWTDPAVGPLLRVSAGIWNSEEQIDRLAEALRA